MGVRSLLVSSPVRARLTWCAAVALAGTGLFVCYLLQSRTYEVNSDGAANALQAWDMLHGNVLLHGWWVTDVSFYTTELPEYVVVEAITGLRPDVVHICGALTYTVLVLVVALAAKGQARGREGVVRALLAGGIMSAPALGYGTFAALNEPDHIGTGIPVMVILLLLDRCDRPKPRWYLPVLILVLLTWVQVADGLATYAAAIPIALVGAIRAVRRGPGPAEPAPCDLLLCLAALASIPLKTLALAVLRLSGGFYQHPLLPGHEFASPAAWPAQARTLGQCVLNLFGADVFSPPRGLGATEWVGNPVTGSYGFMLLHVAGVGVAALGLLAGIGGFFSRMDRVSQILVISVVVVLGAAQFSTVMSDIVSTREIAIVLPASAALAGRVVGAGLARARLEPVLTATLGVVLAGYLAALSYGAAQPAVPAENQLLADWLVAHDLHDGLAGYWQANSLTFDSGEKLAVAPIFGASPYTWDSKSSWYDPEISHPNFVVTVSGPPIEQRYARPSVIRRVFGRPARVYHFQQYTILIWNKNLLTDLGPPPPLPAPALAAGGASPYRNHYRERLPCRSDSTVLVTRVARVSGFLASSIQRTHSLRWV